jgi:hypothetical protein
LNLFGFIKDLTQGKKMLKYNTAIIAIILLCSGLLFAGSDITKVGHFGGSSYSIALTGNYTIVSRGETLVIVDVSDGDHPRELGSIDTGSAIYDIAVSGDYAYLANTKIGLTIIDISNKTKPTIVANIDTDSFAYGIDIDGDYVYVADYDDGLIIFDVKDKSKPKKIGQYNDHGPAMDVDVVGAYAYMANGREGLTIIYLDDKENPVR